MAFKIFIQMARQIKVVNGKVKTSLRMPVELYWRVQEVMKTRRLSSDEAGYIQALQEWTAPDTDDQSISDCTPENVEHPVVVVPDEGQRAIVAEFASLLSDPGEDHDFLNYALAVLKRRMARRK